MWAGHVRHSGACVPGFEGLVGFPNCYSSLTKRVEHWEAPDSKSEFKTHLCRIVKDGLS